MKLVVMIPAYNEEKSIGQVIKRIPKKIYGIDEIEILVIDDGSIDRTFEVSRINGAKVVRKKHSGLGPTFRAGLEASLSEKADIIVNIDADGQFDPLDIPNLIKPILSGDADLALGSRFINNPHVIMPKFKKFGNRAYAYMIKKLTGRRIRDTSCGFRAFNREAALKMNLVGDFTYTHETLLEAINKGLRIKEVPIQVRYFKERKSRVAGSLPNYGVRTLVLIARTIRDHKPLKFFGIPGVIIFILGFLGALYSLIFWLATQTTEPVRTLFNVSAFFLTIGFLVLVLALIADMFRKIRITQEEVLYRLKKNGL